MSFRASAAALAAALTVLALPVVAQAASAPAAPAPAPAPPAPAAPVCAKEQLAVLKTQDAVLKAKPVADAAQAVFTAAVQNLADPAGLKKLEAPLEKAVVPYATAVAAQTKAQQALEACLTKATSAT
jgi:hypothetical protein